MGYPRVHAPASNTAAVITIPAIQNGFVELEEVSFSYDAIPDAGASLTIESPSGEVLHKWYVTGGGVGPISLGNSGLKSPTMNAAMIITLSAGGTGKSGIVNVIQRM